MTERTGLTITDLFCGAGGSGLGARAAGFDLVIAANHWQRAIDTHALNFPDTEHDCADISQVDPCRYPLTDVLWASPECTNHSRARGTPGTAQPDLFGETLPSEAAERSRATMWDVPRFAERHCYKAIVVENVVEASKWVMFPAWLHAMMLLGYEYEIVSLNSMHAQAINAPRAPQSRDRIYVVFWRKGQRKPDVSPSPVAFCEQCGLQVVARQAWKNGRTVGRYRQQYVYVCPNSHVVEPFVVPASAAIDWSLKGLRIGDRERPLSDKTRARIAAGIARYWRPMTFEAAGNTYVKMQPDGTTKYPRVWPVDQPTATMTTTETRALLVPYRNQVPSSVGEPSMTMTCVDPAALVVPLEGREGKHARLISDPMRTVTTRHEDALVQPFIAELRGGGSTARPTTQPLSTVTAGGNNHMLVRHNSVPDGTDPSYLSTPTTEPARTITTAGHQSLVGIEQEIDDATFRMLEPSEIQAVMAFEDSYQVTGTRREKVRQLGNGVTPPAAEFLLRAIAATL